MGKEFEIRTISDIQEVITATNLDNFLKDFSFFLRAALLEKTLNGGTVRPDRGFTWIDDGKNNATITVKIVSDL